MGRPKPAEPGIDQMTTYAAADRSPLMPATAIDGLEPAALWHYFAELSGIPRESKHEKAAGDFVVRVARGLALEHVRDAAGNVLVRKPASSHPAQSPWLCLQCHLDMVCVKRPGRAHNFARDPITLIRVGDYIAADGTTLGADNGIAVAASLAIMADGGLEHGPLELLFTVDEETGLTGARRLSSDMLASRTLLNLDSEEEGTLYIGCAGGRDTIGTWPLVFDRMPPGSATLEIRVSGLKGGHSGVEIHQRRGNAIKLLNRALVEVARLDARIVRLDGGSKRNAIPAEARALVGVPKAKADDARAAIARVRDVLRDELGIVEPELDLVANPSRLRPPHVYKRALQRRVTSVLSGLPHGVIAMSAGIPGLVETSTNVAVLRQTPGSLSLATSQRSLLSSELKEVVDAISAIFELGGARVAGSDAYPGWKPNPDSPILETIVRVYKELYDREPKVGAIHAGLECGIIGEKYPGMDMVSLGPTILDAHSPDERVHIPSVRRFWDFLLATLKATT